MIDLNQPSKTLKNKTVEEEIRTVAARDAIYSNENAAEDAVEDGDKALAAKILALNENLADRAVLAVAAQSDEWFALNNTRLNSVIGASFRYFNPARRFETFDTTMVITDIKVENARIVLS